MWMTNSRRQFLTQAVSTLGFAAWASSEPARAAGWWDDSDRDGPSATSAAKLIEHGVTFLRPRQDAKGGWTTQREPGITALVVTALLRSGQVGPGDPSVTRALGYLEG